MIGCDDIESIVNKIETLKYKEEKIRMNIAAKNKVDVVFAIEKDPYKVKLDKLGYFVILPLRDVGKIVVEHYGNDNSLLHIIEGYSARNIYWTIIDNGWISELSHCAYLGKELTRAELSLEYGFSYVQDKA
jgi:tetrahydromethanopterin S-methyltransferase subunit A